MLLFEQELEVPVSEAEGLIVYLERAVAEGLAPEDVPLRFVVNKTDGRYYHCEVAVMSGAASWPEARAASIFHFTPRKAESTRQFSAALLVPTGIGAEIGGHCGDAGPVARLLASACDTLITHPNVVNGADINELPDNGLYVEGSVISRLLMGTVGLQRVRSNRVLVVTDEHKDPRIADLVINAASAARAALGLDCPLVVKMDPPLRTTARYAPSGRSSGEVQSFERLCEVLSRHRSAYDAVALATVIHLPPRFFQDYFPSEGEMVNPWGGVEAMLTHAVSMLFNVPSAHAPMAESMEILHTDLGVVDPRMSADVVSSTFVYSVLKGLHRSPRIVRDARASALPGVLTAADVPCVVIPDGCVGLATLAAFEQGIPVIAVRENRNRMRNDLEAFPHAPGKLFIVENYLEAVGVMTALRAGVAIPSVRRPLARTTVVREQASVPAAKANQASAEASAGSAAPRREGD